MMKKKENAEENTCNSCDQIGIILDDKGVCNRCNKSYGGKVIKEGNATYKGAKEVFSSSGRFDENIWME